MSGLTDEERELRRLAEAATPGPWEYDGGTYITGATPVEVDWSDELVMPTVINDPNVFDRPEVDRAYVVAANPATVLRLLARIEELEERVRDFENDEHIRVRRLTK